MANAFMIGNNSAEQLRAFIERIERLEEEKRNIGEDIKEVLAEAKGTGFIMRLKRFLTQAILLLN